MVMITKAATRRAASAALIAAPKNLDLRLSRLVAFIGYYQDNHRGETPTVDVLANEMEVSHQTIRCWLGILESEGRIRRIGHNPLRLMLKEGARPIEAARRADEAANGCDRRGWSKQIAELPSKRQERFEAAEARRIKLARFVGEHNQAHGQPPTLTQMMNAVGSSSGAIVNVMLDALCERGILARQGGAHPYRVSLTDNGKMILGFKKKEENMQNTQSATRSGQTVVVVRGPDKKPRRRTRFSQAARFHDAAVAMIRHYETYEVWPRKGEIALAIDCASNRAMHEDIEAMVARGFAERVNPESRFTGYRLTEKGRERLLPPMWQKEKEGSAPEPLDSEPAVAVVQDTSKITYDHGTDAVSVLLDEIADLKNRLAEALTTAPSSVQPMSTADMVLALIEAGYEVRRRA